MSRTERNDASGGVGGEKGRGVDALPLPAHVAAKRAPWSHATHSCVRASLREKREREWPKGCRMRRRMRPPHQKTGRETSGQVTF